MATRKTLFMETTKIPVARTVGDICTCLARHPLVREVSQSYDEHGNCQGIRFTVVQQGCVPCTFQLPARVEPVFRIINGRRQSPPDYRDKDREQAHRVAWRQILRWVEAQLALIETGMVAAQEVFLPYLLDGSTGQTAYECFAQRGLKALPPGTAASVE